MTTEDRSCTLALYFRVHKSRLAAFKELCEQYVERSRGEPSCLSCGFSFHGHIAQSRKRYEDSDGLLTHLENVHPLLDEALGLAILSDLQIHGPSRELAKLESPLAGMGPRLFTVEYEFRR